VYERETDSLVWKRPAMRDAQTATPAGQQPAAAARADSERDDSERDTRSQHPASGRLAAPAVAERDARRPGPAARVAAPSGPERDARTAPDGPGAAQRAAKPRHAGRPRGAASRRRGNSSGRSAAPREPLERLGWEISRAFAALDDPEMWSPTRRAAIAASAAQRAVTAGKRPGEPERERVSARRNGVRDPDDPEPE
jgi:hypothetical protein